jgi:hypothetical protein
MSLFERIKNVFVATPVKEEAPVADPAPVSAPVKTAKEIATEKNEPYIDILSMDIDPNDMQNGAFELDWNDIFVARLVKAGYMKNPKDTDADIVDRWFTDVCRNVVLETYEQYEAISRAERDRVVKSRNIGDGFSEVS